MKIRPVLCALATDRSDQKSLCRGTNPRRDRHRCVGALPSISPGHVLKVPSPDDSRTLALSPGLNWMPLGGYAVDAIDEYYKPLNSVVHNERTILYRDT